MFTTPYGIIVACDVKTLDQMKILMDFTSGVECVVGYKIGFMLGLLNSLPKTIEVARESTDLPIIYDYQKAGSDIPQMGEEFADVMKQSKVDSAIIFPQAGPKTEEAFIKALQKKGVIPMIGGEMTHEKYLSKDGGFIEDSAPERIYEIAEKLGVEYFIVPGNKPDKIKKYSEVLSSPKLCFPGIGRQGGDLEAALSACTGSGYAIIGSAIYKSTDPEESAKIFSAIVKRFL
jgi:orotidine-5'-phosphate decarboxylase